MPNQSYGAEIRTAHLQSSSSFVSHRRFVYPDEHAGSFRSRYGVLSVLQPGPRGPTLASKMVRNARRILSSFFVP